MPAPAPAGTGHTVLGAGQVAVLDDLGPAGHLVRLLDGPHAGAEVVVPSGHVARVASVDARPVPCSPRRPTAAATERAEGLLASLLTPSQQHQRSRVGTFWVHVERGWFRLGALYDIRFRSARWPWVERSVCVVSEGYEGRPTADLWAELVVVVRADPDAVVGVANWNGEDRPRPPATDRAGLTRWVAAVRHELARRRSAGDELGAAYLAFDTAHRLRVAARPAWAASCAGTAARLVRGWADRWPDEADGLLDAHAAVLDLPAALGASAPSPERGR